MGAVSLEEVLRMINQRLERLEGKVDSIDRRVARLEAHVDSLADEVGRLTTIVARSRNHALRWIAVILGMVLSFIAALFGLGWRPPSG